MVEAISRIIATRLIAVALLCCSAQCAIAAMDVNPGSTLRLYDGPGANIGGIYWVQGDLAEGNGPVQQFATFCVELGVNQQGYRNSPGDTSLRYRVDQISDRASTAVASTGRGVLTSVAAWAYSAFRDGTLNTDLGAPSNGVVTQAEVANALQTLIWGQLKYTRLPVLADDSDESRLLRAWIGTTNVAATSNVGGQYRSSGFTGLGNVRVMQLVDINTGRSMQDQLITVPIPEAASLAIWSSFAGVGLAVGWYRRRISSVL